MDPLRGVPLEDGFPLYVARDRSLSPGLDSTGRHAGRHSDAIGRHSDATSLSLADAAVRLGISPDATRKRLERGTLRGEKRSGRWIVYLEPDAAASQGPDAVQDATRTPPDAAMDSDLVIALRDEITFLRTELEARTEEIRRRDHIIAGLIERGPELPAATTGETAYRSEINRPQSDDSPESDVTPVRPVSGSLGLAWRRWWRRVTRGE